MMHARGKGSRQMDRSIFYDLAKFQKIINLARERIKPSLDTLIIEEPGIIILSDLDPERIKTIGWNDQYNQ